MVPAASDLVPEGYRRSTLRSGRMGRCVWGRARRPGPARGGGGAGRPSEAPTAQVGPGPDLAASWWTWGACPEAVEYLMTGVAEVDRAGIDRSTASYLGCGRRRGAAALAGGTEAGCWPRHPEPTTSRSASSASAARACSPPASATGHRPRPRWRTWSAQAPRLAPAAGRRRGRRGPPRAGRRRGGRDPGRSGAGRAAAPPPSGAPQFALLRTQRVEHALGAARQGAVDVPGSWAGLREAIDDAAATGRRRRRHHPRPTPWRLASPGLPDPGSPGPDPEAWAAADLADPGAGWRPPPRLAARPRRPRPPPATRPGRGAAGGTGPVRPPSARPAARRHRRGGRRNRLSVEAPPAVVLAKGTADGLGLTAREAEVLALPARPPGTRTARSARRCTSRRRRPAWSRTSSGSSA